LTTRRAEREAPPATRDQQLGLRIERVEQHLQRMGVGSVQARTVDAVLVGERDQRLPIEVYEDVRTLLGKSDRRCPAHADCGTGDEHRRAAAVEGSHDAVGGCQRVTLPGKWQATCRKGSTVRIDGSSSAQCGRATGHRVRKWQPDGGLIGDGTSP